MLWLGLHFPDLPLEVFTHRDPQVWAPPRWQQSPDRNGQRPVATDNPPDQHIPRVVVESNRVVRHNAAAAAAGIAIGSSLATAHSIIPTLGYYRRSHGQEARRLRRLGEALYRFSSQVSLVPPGGVVVEIGGSLRLFGGVPALTDQAAALSRDMGHRVCCGVAETPLAALTLARSGTNALSAAPLAGAAIEPQHLSPACIEQLGNMGVHTLGQLLALPAEGLADRFGEGLVRYLDRLTGTRADPRQHLHPSARFRRFLHLLAPVRNKQALLLPMQQLLNDLHHWLVTHQLGAEALDWQFAPASKGTPPLQLPVRFATGQQRPARLLEITQLALDRAVLPEEVISLGLAAMRLRPWQTGSQTLFRQLPNQPLPAGQAGALSELVDQLEARLGHGACLGIQALDQHRPEAAWQSVAPLPRPARSAPRKRGADRQPAPVAPRKSTAARRPVWLFVPPQPARPEQLALLRGPERIETGWWEPAVTAPSVEPASAEPASADHVQAGWRDYYVARHANGAECWVFVDGLSRWYLHGYFG